MALQLVLTKSISNYSILTLVDSSGDYHVTDNPGGWGAPNISLSDVDYAHILVETPSGSVYDIDLVADLGIDFNTIASDELIYNISSDLLGLDTNALLTDGIYTIEYRISTDATWVEGAVTNYSINVAVATYFEVQKKVFESIATIPDLYNCSKCCTLQLKDIVTQYMMLQALIAASEYAYLTEFTNILTPLQQITSFDTDLICNC
jgi:hypothetical protein